jgi:hypothetical protein
MRYGTMSKRIRKCLPLANLLILLSLGGFVQPAAADTSVGRVIFATGQPVAVDADGTQRNLQRGDDVYTGDILKTSGNGRLQVSFIDGAYVSIQPDSEYKIEKYRFSGRQDGTESAVLRLIKGGVRAVTGLIGKEHHDAYKVHTAAATIGIRGTGYNTRICQGDCPGKKDGLYHNTWEGITYVFNNVGNVEIPAGQGVYVRDMNTPIQLLLQPSPVTALQMDEKREQEQQSDEDQSTVNAAGDQRNDNGLQTVVVGDSSILPTPSKTLLNQGFVAVSPGNAATNAKVDSVTGTHATFFANANGFIGVLASVDDDNNGGPLRSVGTIDIAAMLGGDDPASVAEVNSLLSAADQTQVKNFLNDPAMAAESVINPVGIAWGRWTDGRVLIMDETGHTEAQQLTGYQSMHFIFGPEPPVIPNTGYAYYGFLGGTRSTSASGATIGDGVLGGTIYVQFAQTLAYLGMDVGHNGGIYNVIGQLEVDGADNHINSAIPGGVAAYMYDNPAHFNTVCGGGIGCPAQIEGTFTGPSNTQGNPTNIGIQYSIGERDPITGVAAFSTSLLPQETPPPRAPSDMVPPPL